MCFDKSAGHWGWASKYAKDLHPSGENWSRNKSCFLRQVFSPDWWFSYDLQLCWELFWDSVLSCLGVESGESPAASWGVEVFTSVLQTRPALFPLGLQGFSALLLRLLQLLKHFLSQFGCLLFRESKPHFPLLTVPSAVLPLLTLLLPSSSRHCAQGMSWAVDASVHSATSPPSFALPHTEPSSLPRPQVSHH